MPTPQLDLRSISGVQGMSVAELQQAVAAGGKFVCFQFCFSVIVMSFKRSSPIIFLRPGESAFSKGLLYSLISLVAGWWGIPWGPIWTLTTVAENISGGKDLTAQVLPALGVPTPPRSPASITMSPIETAERADREARKTLILRLGWGVVALMFLFAGYAAYKIFEVGRSEDRQAGEAEFRSANTQIGSGGAAASGNNEKARQLAAEMSRMMQADREKNFSQAAKKSMIDQRDEFRTYCYLQEDDRCVFLIHVPELLRFDVEAKQSLAEAAWLIAQGLLSKGEERIDLAVAFRGIAAYDRVLTGEYVPGNAENLKRKPKVYDGLSCEKKLVPWFAADPAMVNQ